MDTRYPYGLAGDYFVSEIGAVSKPSLRSFKYKPRRVRPSVRAAWEIFPLLLCSVTSMISRSSPSTADANEVMGPRIIVMPEPSSPRRAPPDAISDDRC